MVAANRAFSADNAPEQYSSSERTTTLTFGNRLPFIMVIEEQGKTTRVVKRSNLRQPEVVSARTLSFNPAGRIKTTLEATI